jgi:hypothetical protein
MNEIIVAFIGTAGIVLVALIETTRRVSKRTLEENRLDHAVVMDKIDDLGKNLGRSIDRVEKAALRTEKKLDQHINDHLTGKID